MLICYEQILVWPVLASMSQHPTVLIGAANDHWAAGTPIPRFQHSAVRAWSRLFAIPYLSAVNF
jgi:apolipoprotein N-acyltransferase